MLSHTTKLLEEDQSVISILDLSSKKRIQKDEVALMEESSIEELNLLVNRVIAPKIKEILFREYFVHNLFLTFPSVISRINPIHPQSQEKSNLVYTMPHSDLETYQVSYYILSTPL